MARVTNVTFVTAAGGYTHHHARPFGRVRPFATLPVWWDGGMRNPLREPTTLAELRAWLDSEEAQPPSPHLALGHKSPNPSSLASSMLRSDAVARL